MVECSSLKTEQKRLGSCKLKRRSKQVKHDYVQGTKMSAVLKRTANKTEQCRSTENKSSRQEVVGRQC